MNIHADAKNCPQAKIVAREDYKEYFETFLELVRSMLNTTMDRTRMSTVAIMASQIALPRAGKVQLAPIYTRIQEDHAGQEVNVLHELLLLDQAYRAHFKEFLGELSVQRMAAAMLMRLTEHSVAQAELNCRPPHTQSVIAEDVIINRYQVHYQIILSSNLALGRGVDIIRKNLLAFRREYHKLDLKEETEFILGDKFHKPIKFFLELAEDLFNYFHSHYLRLDCVSRQLDTADMATLEQYQKYLEPCQEFEEYLLHNLGYCQCLAVEGFCYEPPLPMPSHKLETVELIQRARKKRCDRRREKMTHTGGLQTAEEPSASTTAALMELEKAQNTIFVDLDHEMRMKQLSARLAQLRAPTAAPTIAPSQAQPDRGLVEQMIYGLSPSLIPSNYVPDTSPRNTL